MISSWKMRMHRYFEASFLYLEPLTIALSYIALGNPIAGVKSGARAFSLLGQLIIPLIFVPISAELGFRGLASPVIQV